MIKISKITCVYVDEDTKKVVFKDNCLVSYKIDYINFQLFDEIPWFDIT